jgi:Fe-S-cluster containining protein
MQLCKTDIERLERRGFKRDDFVLRGADGIHRLRNTGGYCYFYDQKNRRCREYPRRPLGCVIYPVNMSFDGEVVVDELCPEASSVGREEFDGKGRRLRRLLDTIAIELEMNDASEK